MPFVQFLYKLLVVRISLVAFAHWKALLISDGGLLAVLVMLLSALHAELGVSFEGYPSCYPK